MNDQTRMTDEEINRQVADAGKQWETQHYERMGDLWAEWRMLIAVAAKPARDSEAERRQGEACDAAQDIALEFYNLAGMHHWMIRHKAEMLAYYMPMEAIPLRDIILACIMHDLED